jgi:hypothetical protein
MRLLTALFLSTIATTALAETAVERQCKSGKCTCTYIANTCKEWNKTHGGDLAVCDRYRAACLASGEYHDNNRNIAPVIRR